MLLLAELLDRAGDHQRAHNLVRSAARAALRGAPDAATLRVWRIAYPPAFRSEIERWAAPAGVEPDLLQALMREESALDPRVVSGAGAVGLTQLMPATAQQVARKLKLRRPSAQDLMDAPLNIRLGAAHLGELLQKFGGSAPLAVAAYNAGTGAVRRWVRARRDAAARRVRRGDPGAGDARLREAGAPLVCGVPVAVRRADPPHPRSSAQASAHGGVTLRAGRVSRPALPPPRARRAAGG